MGIKSFIFIIVMLISVLAFSILKTDPVREGNQGRAEAVNQVKAFANFIQDRPDMVARQSGSYDLLSTSSGSAVNENSDSVGSTAAPLVSNEKIDQDFGNHLNRYADPENREKLREFARKYPDEVYRYLNHKVWQAGDAYGEEWDASMNGVLILSELKHSTALDLLGEQIVNARINPDKNIQQRADSLLQHYIAYENRSERLNQTVENYNQQVERSSMVERVPASDQAP